MQNIRHRDYFRLSAIYNLSAFPQAPPWSPFQLSVGAVFAPVPIPSHTVYLLVCKKILPMLHVHFTGYRYLLGGYFPSSFLMGLNCSVCQKCWNITIFVCYCYFSLLFSSFFHFFSFWLTCAESECRQRAVPSKAVNFALLSFFPFICWLDGHLADSYIFVTVVLVHPSALHSSCVSFSLVNKPYHLATFVKRQHDFPRFPPHFQVWNSPHLGFSHILLLSCGLGAWFFFSDICQL